jgi:hypothetical protein
MPCSAPQSNVFKEKPKMAFNGEMTMQEIKYPTLTITLP